ncbi:MAG: T9SS type A sorting domain-containing protein [candidate division WOR-3 bacterium]
MLLPVGVFRTSSSWLAGQGLSSAVLTSLDELAGILHRAGRSWQRPVANKHTPRKEETMFQPHVRSFSALLAVVSALAAVVTAQPCRIIGGASTDQGSAIVRAYNPYDGYVIGGWTFSFGAGTTTYSNALVVRTNAYGTPLNAIVSKGARDDQVTSIARTTDSGYVVTGWTRSYDSTSSYRADVFVLKLKTDLSLSWGYVYHITNADYDHRALSIIEVSSALGGGYALTGWADTVNARRILVMRLTATGAVSWARCYSFVGDNWDEGYSITEVADTSAPSVKFCVVGSARTSSTAQADAFVLRLMSDGGIVGANRLYGAYDDAALSVVADPTGASPGIVVAGHTKSYGLGKPNYYNIFVAKLRAATGNYIWSNVFYWPAGTLERDERLLGDRALIRTTGNLGTGYALCGLTYSRGPNTPGAANVLLIKLDYYGNLGWGGSATVHPSDSLNNYHDMAYAIVQTSAIPGLPSPGDGIALVGASNSFSKPTTLGGYNLLFSTFDRTGKRPAGCALQFALAKDSCFWTTLTAKRVTISINQQSMPVEPCAVNSQAVCGGTDLGIVPGPSTQVAQQVEPEPGNLRIAPNPFSRQAEVSYFLARPGRVELKLYDISGKLVATLRSGRASAGQHCERLHRADLASGVYLLKFESEQGAAISKVTIE